MQSELLTRLRKELETERGAVIDELESLGADPHSEKVARPAGLSENFADSAQASSERAQLLSMVEKGRDRLAQVDAALAKIDQGTYGICEVCGDAIPEARLEARPMSTRCIVHA